VSPLYGGHPDGRFESVFVTGATSHPIERASRGGELRPEDSQTTQDGEDAGPRGDEHHNAGGGDDRPGDTDRDFAPE